MTGTFEYHDGILEWVAPKDLKPGNYTLTAQDGWTVDDLCPYCHRIDHHPICTPELRKQLGGRGGSSVQTLSTGDRRVRRCKE